MFQDIPDKIHSRMTQLEAIDTRDRTDGTPRLDRLRQITRDTGQFIAILAASSPEGAWLEIGTSAGYSTLWLALACRAADRTITTIEILPDKARLARETFQCADVGKRVNLVEGDALEIIPSLSNISFCFLDAEKEVYSECYELVVPRMVSGGILVADNVISHAAQLAPFVDRAISDDRVDALVVPIGKGELVCRKL